MANHKSSANHGLYANLNANYLLIRLCIRIALIFAKGAQ